MKSLGAALVCIAVLYGIDAFFFDGRYGHGMDHAISDISALVSDAHGKPHRAKLQTAPWLHNGLRICEAIER